MDDGKIVPNLDPTLYRPSAPAMDSLKDGRFHPFSTGTSLTAYPSRLVFEVEGEIGPSPSILKGLQLQVDFVVSD
jgi:hypothetical protein